MSERIISVDAEKLRPGIDYVGVFGPEVFDLADLMSKGMAATDTPTYRELRVAIDANFQEYMANYLTPEGEQMPVATVQQLVNDANACEDHMHGVLFSNGQQSPGTLNNLRTMNGSIVDGRLRYIFAPDNEVTAEYRHSAERQIASMLGHGLIRRRSAELQIPQRVSQVVDALEKQVWMGRYGETIPRQVYSLHDNVTNFPSWVAFTDEYDIDPNRQHVKKHDYRFRQARVGGSTKWVYSDIREKPFYSQYLKALREARKNGGKIDPYVGIKDSMGALFAVGGDYKDTDEFAEQVVYAIDRVIEVDEATCDHIEDMFYHRWNIKFKDWPVHLEAMFYPMIGYLRSKYEVKRKPDDAGTTGRAHDIYAVDRLEPLVPFMVPEHIYGYNPAELISHAREATAERLLTKNKVR